jgi:hypothetical protein
VRGGDGEALAGQPACRCRLRVDASCAALLPVCCGCLQGRLLGSNGAQLTQGEVEDLLQQPPSSGSAGTGSGEGGESGKAGAGAGGSSPAAPAGAAGAAAAAAAATDAAPSSQGGSGGSAGGPAAMDTQ